jgi:hypothetical protein
MSEVISFRLDPQNPREAKALKVIHSWQQEGFSTRQILVEALEKLEPNSKFTYYIELFAGMNEKLDKLVNLLSFGYEGREIECVDVTDCESVHELSSQFMTTIKMTAKSGIGFQNE